MPEQRPVRIFVNDEPGRAARESLAGFEVVGPGAEGAALAECAAAMVWPFRVPEETWKSLSGLKVVQTLTAGADAVKFKLIPPGAAVLSNAGAYAEVVGEHAWGLLMGAAKGVHSRNAKVPPRILRGGSLLVVGCGAIGSEVARIARASLSMKTVGVSRSFRHPEHFDVTRPVSDLAEAMGAADAMVLALPLTVHTRALLDYGVLARAKETVVIANVGRGELVDEGSLFRLLSERPETRYATDVFWEKEGKESYATRLWELPNFAGTLHTAGAGGGHEAMDEVKRRAAENLRSFLTTGAAANAVDPREYDF